MQFVSISTFFALGPLRAFQEAEGFLDEWNVDVMG